MGTNFYVNEPPCDCPCDHCEAKPLHIGKSSAGWQFTFRSHEGGPTSWQGWKQRLLFAAENPVRDEYGREHTRSSADG